MNELVDVPPALVINNKSYIVIDRMNNFHYRALVLPLGGGNPKWISNAEVKEAKEAKILD